MSRETDGEQVPCFPLTCLFVLSASSGPHGVKIIINRVIESLVGTDLLGRTQAGSRFVSVAADGSSGERRAGTGQARRRMFGQTRSSCLSGIVNRVVEMRRGGTSSVQGGGVSSHVVFPGGLSWNRQLLVTCSRERTIKHPGLLMAQVHQVHLFSKTPGSSWSAVPSKRLGPATRNVKVFHRTPDEIPAPKGSIDADLILSVSSNPPSALL